MGGIDLDRLGKLLVIEVKKQIILMELVDIGDLLDSIRYEVKNRKLFLVSDVNYAEEIEYGTYDLKSTSDTDFPSTAQSAKSLKKKDMDSKKRSSLPKGMVPFAPFRRVLHNENLMQSLVLQSMK